MKNIFDNTKNTNIRLAIYHEDGMKNTLDNTRIEIPCSSCKTKNKKKIKWIKNNKKLRCPCGTVINLESKKFKTELRKIEKKFKIKPDTYIFKNTEIYFDFYRIGNTKREHLEQMISNLLKPRNINFE